jgi:hypothetical protein
VFSRHNAVTKSGIDIRFSLPKVTWVALQFCYWPSSAICAPSVTKQSNFHNPEVFSRHNAVIGSGIDIRFSLPKVTWVALQFCFWPSSAIYAPSVTKKYIFEKPQMFSRSNSGTGSCIDIRFSLSNVTWSDLQFCFGPSSAIYAPSVTKTIKFRQSGCVFSP